MKKIIIGVIVAIAIVGGLIWLGQTNEQSTANTTATNSVTFADVTQSVTNGAKLYDVRTAEEYDAGHFAGATNFPLQDLQNGTFPDVAKDTKIYVYCHSGNRSGQATVLLQNAGYTNVTDLHGLTDVEQIGGTLVTN